MFSEATIENLLELKEQVKNFSLLFAETIDGIIGDTEEEYEEDMEDNLNDNRRIT